MVSSVSIARRAFGLLLGPALLFAIGCSDDGLGKRFAVSGTVSYKGQPVTKARISFVPTKGEQQGASGEVVDGKFDSMTTLTPGDGVLAGEYKVLVDQREVDEAQVKSDSAELAKKHGLGEISQVPPEVQAKAMQNAKSSIPGKYQMAETTDLTATVDASHTKFQFDLKD